jgi:hypothetical protein
MHALPADTELASDFGTRLVALEHVDEVIEFAQAVLLDEVRRDGARYLARRTACHASGITEGLLTSQVILESAEPDEDRADEEDDAETNDEFHDQPQVS